MNEEEICQFLELINDYGKEMYALGRKAQAENRMFLDKCEETRYRDLLLDRIFSVLFVKNRYVEKKGKNMLTKDKLPEDKPPEKEIKYRYFGEPTITINGSLLAKIVQKMKNENISKGVENAD